MSLWVAPEVREGPASCCTADRLVLTASHAPPNPYIFLKQVHSPCPALRFDRSPPTIRHPARLALMPFTIRPFHRFAVYCPVTYHAGLFEDHGTESLAEWVASLGGTCHCESVRRAPSRSICRTNKVSSSRLPLCGGCEVTSMRSNHWSWKSTQILGAHTM